MSFMIDVQSPTGQRQASLLGIPSSGSTEALAAIEAGLDTGMIKQHLVERGYSRDRLDQLIKSVEEGMRTSDVDTFDAWVHVTRYVALAEIVFGDPAKAAHWLQRDSVHIGGAPEAPIIMLATSEGAHQVEERSQQIRYGMYVSHDDHYRRHLPSSSGYC